MTVTTVPRVRRGSNKALEGYQRPEVASHIAEIRRYIETADAVLPNAIVIAFDDRVRFSKTSETGSGEIGILHVPAPKEEESPPGFVVDGQQRLAAVSSCAHERFPIFVTAMIATSEEEQRKQFVLVNRTKPLPQGLIFELLPAIDGCLPTVLARQQQAATLTTLLNLDPESSLFGMVNTPTTPSGIIKDNSLRRLLSNSLTDGALAVIMLDEPDPAERNYAMVELVSTFWKGLTHVFPTATRLPASRSRLTHGVGMAALGFVMDALYLQRGSLSEWSPEYVESQLERIAAHCAWTEGEWKFESGARRWNDLQNIDRDIRMLTGHFRKLLAHKAGSPSKSPEDSQIARCAT